MTRTRKIALAVAGVLLLLVLAGVVLSALVYMSLRGSEPSIAENSVLVLPLRGALPDYAPTDPVTARFFGGAEMSMADFLMQLKKSKADKRIAAILLEIDGTGAGWGKADEIRDAIADYRRSGKPIYAYMEAGGNKEYYIAAACDRVYVAPIGDLFINGLAAEVMFYRGSLDKLGVFADYYQIGKYKNAPDQMTRREMSEAHREATNALLDDIFNRFVATVAAARQKSPEDVRALIDSAPLSAPDAATAGLIDGAKYREDVDAELKKQLKYKDSDKLRTVKLARYRQVSPESLDLNRGERVAVIYASGLITSGRSSGGGPFGGDRIAGSETLVKAINDARDNKEVKAIVLRVDSPGGSSYASDVIWYALEKAKEKKPVVVSMSDAAASGGYYVSAGAHKIVSEPSTVTGSIGVFAGKTVLKGFYDWIGVNSEYITRGKNAAIFRETEQFTPEERKKFEGMIDNFYWDDFLPKVAKGRNKDVEYVHSVAQGRVWTGAQAKERGLVDEFGGMERAMEIARDLAKIPADKGVRPVIYPAPKTVFEEIFGGGRDDSAQSGDAEVQRQRQALIAQLPEDMRRPLRVAFMLDRMKRGEIMALMPFDLSIR